MNVNFYVSGGLGSGFMRGLQICESLREQGINAKLVKSLDNEKDSIVIALKSANPEILRKAKDNGNIIVFDLIDKLSRKIFPQEVIELKEADYLLHCSETSGKYWTQLFDKPWFSIPHHWDNRINTSTEYPAGLRIGYIGANFNALYLDMFPDVIPIYGQNAWIQYAPFFTLHYNIRNPNEAIHKPDTKVALAAACGANIITLKTEATQELLGSDYPYYVEECKPETVFQVMEKAAHEFGCSEWNRGLEIIKDVRGKTSIESVTKQYIEMLEQIQWSH